MSRPRDLRALETMMRKPPRYYKLRTVASLLPKWALRWLVRHWKLDYDPSDGWTFWLDADYVKWCRWDKRRKHDDSYYEAEHDDWLTPSDYKGAG